MIRFRSRLALAVNAVRRTATWLVWGGVALILLRTWFVEGFLAPCVISGGSMAPTLLGRHQDILCRRCGLVFPCDAEHEPLRPTAVCPNCGCRDNDRTDRPLVDGDRVLVDRTAFFRREPRRWEVVALRDPTRPECLLIKRVVGLPGEAIEIRDGDVLANGVVCSKSPAVRRAMAILVHDASCLPEGPDARPPRWRPDPASKTKTASSWDLPGERFVHRRRPDESGVDWLVYHHEQQVGDRFQEMPVTDDTPYEQSRPRWSETVHAVSDLTLRFRVTKWSGLGRLVVRMNDGLDVFEVTLDPGRRQFAVRRRGQAKLMADGKWPARVADSWDKMLEVDVSLCDRRLTLVLDDRTVADVPLDNPNAEPGQDASGVRRPVAKPLALGATDLDIEIDGVRVYRDVYYTDPIQSAHRWGIGKPAALPADAYFVLGDNSPISEDSRTWPVGPAAASKWLLGKPFVVWFPRTPISWGPWRFRVPDPSRIRYIR